MPRPPASPPTSARGFPLATACLLVALLLAAPARAAPPRAKGAQKGAKKLERYPASFRLAVKKAIADGVRHLGDLQALDGHWGDPENAQAMGHTALPLLAMLKAGVPKEEIHVRRALRALARMKMQRVYSVALYMMALHAAYEPQLDTLDTDVGTRRSKRVKPDAVRAQLSAADVARFEAGRTYLLRAQNASGLWHYDVPAADATTAHDLSNSQYGLERMGMLTGRRWLGAHDWYKEGADMLLKRQDPLSGGWGRHVTTSFGILFLKRATRRRDMVVTTD